MQCFPQNLLLREAMETRRQAPPSRFPLSAVAEHINDKVGARIVNAQQCKHRWNRIERLQADGLLSLDGKYGRTHLPWRAEEVWRRSLAQITRCC